jgi:hypothetical protein
MIQLPPALIYGLGILLVVFGGLRAFHMGWRRRDREIEDEGRGGRRGPKYHLMVGILWVVMGLFLVISTYVQSR